MNRTATSTRPSRVRPTWLSVGMIVLAAVAFLLFASAAPAEEPAAAQPPAEKDPHAWRDLFDGESLKSWKAANFTGGGKITVDDGAIVMAMGADMSGIVYTGEPPRTNYEVAWEGKRIQGGDFFATLTFPVGKDHCSFVTGGWGGTIVGLSSINYYDASDNSTTRFMTFKDQQWYKFRVRVTDAKIEAWVDDAQVVDQERGNNKISIRIEVDPCRPLGFSSWCTSGAVRNIRLRQLTAEEAKPKAE